MQAIDDTIKKPAWLRGKIGSGENCRKLTGIIHSSRVHTVCDEALCPNKGICWENGRATIMILGRVCSRNCRFCNVEPGVPPAADHDEPARVADAVRMMGLKDVVITSVTRDDLPDGGVGIWVDTIEKIKEQSPLISIEVLIPDFAGKAEAINSIVRTQASVVGHNLETVPRLYGEVRPQADYKRSLALLKTAHEGGKITKTGLMLGLGETQKEVLDVMADARAAGCNIFFAGQYLQPTKKHLPVQRFVEPSEFDMYCASGIEMGFAVVVAAPLVRSSFHSELQSEYIKNKIGVN